MKTLFGFAITLMLFFCVVGCGNAQNAQTMLTNGPQGREFWIAIPPNEKPQHPTNAIEIYVTSRVNTMVTVEVPGLGYLRTKKVEAFKITTFGAAEGISAGFEVREHGVSPLGMKITSPDHISVNVLNAKPVTSEGFMALPVSVWGKENIHCGFYDFGEIKPWGGGFIVVASQDQTVITIQIKGKGFGRTTENNKIGDFVQKTLQKGEVYMMKGNGATLGTFDITGTKITSTKPVGLISFHERTMIPAIGNNNGRDNLAEMIPPTSAWGKTFVSAEFQRNGKGDLFRAVAKEDDTQVKCSWYDKVTKQKIQTLQWVLKAGEFQEFSNASTSPGGESIRGYSVWEANKPILLMQYAYSAQWDGASEFDPFMLVVPPVEQYMHSALFQTPPNSTFTTNWFNLFAVGDSTDADNKLLKTIKLDGKFLWESDPKILLQRIPRTNIYYLAKNLTPGAHTIESQSNFSAFMYGFSDFDSYGWPVAMAINKIDELDTLEPEVQVTQKCGVFSIRATDDPKYSGNTNDNPRQVQSGISDVLLISELSTNFKTQADPVAVVYDPVQHIHNFNLEVLDLTKDARAVYEVIDRAGNVVRDTVDYIADKLTLNTIEIDFGKVRVGTSKEFDITITNNGSQTISLKDFFINNPDIFYTPNSSKELLPGSSATIKIRYSPKQEFTDQYFDKDSLVISTNCARFAYAISGRGIMPKIAVGNFSAGSVKVGEKVCLNDGLCVANTGSDDLIIKGLSGFATPFTFTSFSPLPVTIPPGDTLFLQEACFQGVFPGTVTQDITIESDAMAGDSISTWSGFVAIISVNDISNNYNLLKVSPNPASTGEITAEGNLLKSGLITVELFDNAGKSVKIILKEYSDNGVFKAVFSAKELSSGVYYCRLSVNDEVVTTQEIVISK